MYNIIYPSLPSDVREDIEDIRVSFFFCNRILCYSNKFFILYTRNIRESLKQLLLYLYGLSRMHTPHRATESFILITRPRNSYPRDI